MEIVKNSAKDCYPAVQKTTLVIMERLQQVLQMEVSPALLAYSAPSLQRSQHGSASKAALTVCCWSICFLRKIEGLDKKHCELKFTSLATVYSCVRPHTYISFLFAFLH